MTRHARQDELRRYPGFSWIAGGALVFLYAPLIVITVFSFNAVRSTSVWGGISLDWYAKALANPLIRQAAINSLIVALVAASLATLLATLAALAIGRGRRLPGQTAATTILSLPLLVPEIITAVASLVFFVAVGLPLGFPAIIAAHTAFCIPFAYLPILARLEMLEGSLEEASRDLYATRFETLRYVILPLMTPGLVAGFSLAFIVSLDDFIITSFVNGPGAGTLPVVIYGMARTGFTPEINAISSLMLLVSIVVVACSWRLTSMRVSHGP